METNQIVDDLVVELKPFMRRQPEGFVLQPGSSLTQDLGIDSADMMDLCPVAGRPFFDQGGG